MRTCNHLVPAWSSIVSIRSKISTAFEYLKMFKYLFDTHESESVTHEKILLRRTEGLVECERSSLIKSVFFDFEKVRKYRDYRVAFPESYISSDSEVDLDATLGKDCVIWSSKVEGSVSLGDYSTISEGGFIGGFEQVIIGKFCSVARNCFIYSSCHNYKLRTITPLRTIRDNRKESDSVEFYSHPVTIGNDVWIGRDVKILAGATIPDGCVVGAGAVVTKGDFEPYSILVGVPAVCIKKRFSDEVIEDLLQLRWWDKGDAVFDDEMLDYLLSPAE